MRIFPGKSKGKLKYRIALPTTVVIVALLAVCICLSWFMQQRQAEETMRDNAYILAEEMAAVWDFVSESQDRINYDSDGTYDFKGIHCSIAGLSVGALFTSRTDYEISYASANPRNPQNAADEVELQAIEAFEGDDNLTALYQFAESDGTRYFRYIAPLRIERACLECHGQPAGELDVTGFPREGMAVGDLVGVTNIAIPTQNYERNLAQSVALQALFLFLLAIGCIGVIRFTVSRYVTRPLEGIEGAIGSGGSGVLSAPLDASEVGAKDELGDLVGHLNETSRQLDELYRDLEGQVDERTRQLMQANDELQSQAQALSALNERLRQDNLYKTHYFTMMSHELKTPLTAITAYTNMLDELARTTVEQHLAVPEAAVEPQRILGEIRSNTAALMHIISLILESARLEAGKVQLEPRATDAVDLFAALDKTLSPLAEEKRIALYYCAAQEVPLFMADPDKLLHVLENLGANALRHSPEGASVVFDAYFRRKDQAILLRVMDEGEGIPPEEQPLIFERFVQAKSQVTAPVKGTGLGLALAKEYTELHGGVLEVSSEPGQGSVFTAVIPYRPVVCEED